MKLQASGASELPRKTLLAHRRCAVCAASPAAPGAGRRKWRNSERCDDETYLGRPQAEGWDRARGPSAAPGDFSHSRSATRAPDPRNPYDYQGRKDESVSSGQPRLPPPGPYGAQIRGSRRSEQEQAARKAARLVDKAAESVRNNQGCCYGCGAVLQTDVPRAAGYVTPDKYAARKHRRQLDQVLCQRCSELCNGAMIPGVQDFTQKLQMRQLSGEAAPGSEQQQVVAGDRPQVGSRGTSAAAAATGAAERVAAAEGPSAGEEAAATLLGKVLVSPEQLRGQLKTLALRAAVVVLLVDLLDASGSLLSRVRDMVGRNPIVMVGTKMDLLPERCWPAKVAEWLADAAASKKLNVVSVHLVSSHTGQGMSAAVSAICRERKSRDVFVVGAANVGKSAFVRAMLKEMARTDPVALGAGKYLPVESAMPGTTLGLIPLRAFSEGGVVFDTPGVHLHHRIPHMLSPEELKLLHPRRHLVAFVPPLPVELSDSPEGAEDVDGSQEANDGDVSTTASEGFMKHFSSGRDSRAGAGEAAVRRGRGGLKILDFDPTDEYGIPITEQQGGSRRSSGESRNDVINPPKGESSGSGGRLKLRRLPKTVNATYMWSDLIRIDVLSGPPSTALVFYGPSTMRAVGLPYIRPDQKLEIDYTSNARGGVSRNVLVCTESVSLRGGLQPREVVVRANGAMSGAPAPLADVAVSGLPGWLSVWAPRADQDVRLRVWAPRGVEVMLRPPLPCPIPTSLKQAWRGERGSGGSDGGGEEGAEDEQSAALDEWSRALAADVGDPTDDPAWWEAMAALKDEDLPGYNVAKAAGSTRTSSRRSSVRVQGSPRERQGVSDDEKEEEEEEVQELPDWDDEADAVDDSEDGEEEEERVIVTARVEDILKRPRLDFLNLMDLDDEDVDEEGRLDDDDVSGFMFTRSAAGRRRRNSDGPPRDGVWNPFAQSGIATTTASSADIAAAQSGGTRKLSTAATTRRKSSRMAAAEREQEEGEVAEPAWSYGASDIESEEGSYPRQRVRSRGKQPRRLGRRRDAIRVDASESVEEVAGEVA